MLLIKSLTLPMVVLYVLLFPAVLDRNATTPNPPGRLGIEITTDTNFTPLYIPVALSNEKSMVAYIPVTNGVYVTAVRIEPVMQDGKVRFASSAVSGDYASNRSCADVKQLPARLIGTHQAARAETITVSDNLTTTSWIVKIKAVDLRPPIKISGQSGVPNLSNSFQEPFDMAEGPCGCAQCSRKDPLLCCPARGHCMECSNCGTVCCPNG